MNIEDKRKNLIEHFPTNQGRREDLEFNRLDRWVKYILHEELYDFYIDYYCFKKMKPLPEVVDHIERTIIIWAILKCNGNRTRVAQFLNIGYSTIMRKIKKYDIDRLFKTH